MKKIESYFSPNGTEINSIEELRNYMMTKNFTLKELRRTPYFAMQFEKGDLSDYNRLAENLKLRDQNGTPVEDEYIYELIRNAENEQLIEDLAKKFEKNIPKNEKNLVQRFKNMLIDHLKYFEEDPSLIINEHEYITSVAERIIQLQDIDHIKRELIKDDNLEKIRKISRGVIFKKACETLHGTNSGNNIDVDKEVKKLEDLLKNVEEFNKKEASFLVSEAYLDAEYIKDVNTEKFSFRLNRERQELINSRKKKEEVR